MFIMAFGGLSRGILIDIDYANMLLQLFYFGPEVIDFLLLRLGILLNLLELLVQQFVLIPLLLYVGLEFLVVAAGLLMQLVLNHLGLLNQYIHHHVNFFSDLVGLFFEQLENVVALDQIVLQTLDLLRHTRRHVIDPPHHHLRLGHASVHLGRMR